MKRPPPSRRRVAGFTLVELLLSLALGVLVALILSALLRGLLAADQAQSLRLRGPLATRGALRTMSREIAAAFPPPGTNTIPLQLEAAPTPGQIESRLTLHVPVNIAAAEATFDNGVLNLVLPKAEEAKPHRIVVKSAE